MTCRNTTVPILTGLGSHINSPTTATMTSRQHSENKTNCPASNFPQTEKSRNAIAVQQCRDRKKKKEKETEEKIESLKDDNQRLRTNISAMEAEMRSLQNIFEAHDVASGGLFGQDSELKEFFK